MENIRDIIFDTDLGGDCDDVMALDLLLSAEKCGECRLLGVTYSADAYAAIPCIYAILRHYGRGDVPIGRAPVKEGTVSVSDNYASKVAEAFRYDGAPDYNTTPEASALLRRLLSEATGKVTLVVTGFLTNITALLKSGPDEYSPLSGPELVREKVEEIAIMACNFSHINCIAPEERAVCRDGTIKPLGEWNIICDIKAAQEMFALVTAPVVLLPYEAGLNMITGAPMAEHGGMDAPDSMSYIVHGSRAGRHSWDPATALYGVYGARPWFYKSSAGRVTIRDDGVSDFAVDPDGLCSILECAQPKEQIATAIDELVGRLF